jgi:hypothetical protein
MLHELDLCGMGEPGIRGEDVFWGVIAMVAAMALTQMLAMGWPNVLSRRMTEGLEGVASWSAVQGGAMMGVTLETSYGQVSRKRPLSEEPSLSIMNRMLVECPTVPFLLVGCVVVVWVGAKRERLPLFIRMGLAILAAVLVGVGLPGVSGFLQGLAIGMDIPTAQIVVGQHLAKDVAPMVVVLLIVGSWLAAKWSLVEDSGEVESKVMKGRSWPAMRWAAAGAVFFVAVIFTYATAGTLMAKPGGAVGSFLAMRYGVSAGVSIFAFVASVVALAQGRGNVWMWIPPLVLLFSGSEASGAFAFLVAVAGFGRQENPR